MNELTQLFMDLVKIPSSSGKELIVGNYIKRYLHKLKIKSKFDQAGMLNDSNSGNLIVKLDGDPALPTVLFVAHMDTVETGKDQIVPKVEKGIIKSRGNTILGADNKVSVACLLISIKEIKSWTIRPTILFAFTTREEEGRMGSSLLNVAEKIDYCFNLDGPEDIGNFVYQTLGEVPFEISLKGKAAHAAVEPENGINAIKAAAVLINQLPIGRNKKGVVLNIGKISGGTANNVVPDEVTLKGQVRAFYQNDIDSILNKIEEALKRACSISGCSYEFIKKPEEGAPVASINKKHQIITIAKNATKAIGKSPNLLQGFYTADSNFLAGKYPTVTVCSGGKLPHSFDEYVSIESLNELQKLIKAIIKQMIG